MNKDKKIGDQDFEIEVTETRKIQYNYNELLKQRDSILASRELELAEIDSLISRAKKVGIGINR